MYALPSQSLEQARRDIQTAIACAPPHLSLYHLTLEPNTLFAKYPPAVPDDDASADMQDMIADLTTTAGYGHYEVSAYAQPQRQARHNLNYWQFGDYLGIGAGAHSKLSFPHRIVRQMRHKHPSAYLENMRNGIAIQEESEISRDALGFEFMLNALRLQDGFPVNLFAERTGMGINTIETALNHAETKGLLYRDHKLIRPTELDVHYLWTALSLHVSPLDENGSDVIARLFNDFGLSEALGRLSCIVPVPHPARFAGEFGTPPPG
eukprot:gene30971-35259_t